MHLSTASYGGQPWNAVLIIAHPASCVGLGEMWRKLRRLSLLLLRVALVCLALSLVVFLLTTPRDLLPADQRAHAAGRDVFPWEAEGAEDIAEFKGPKRNLQTALEIEDVFTQPLTTAKLVRRPQFNHSVVQQSRQMAMQATCQNQSGLLSSWEDLSPTEQSVIAQRIIVNEDYKLLFCTVPLTAIGPWMKVFYLLGPGRDLKDTTHIPASELANKRNFVYLSSFSPSEQAEKMSTYLRFMVARHPFLRVAVAYKMKFEADNKFFHERYGKEIVQKYRPGATGREPGSDVQFSEFIEYLLALEEESEMNEHWQPLNRLCRPCEMGYDFILHHETLAQDASELLEQAQLTKRVPHLPTDAWDHISIQYAHSLFQSITPAWIGKLVQKYRRDFSMFSYASLF